MKHIYSKPIVLLLTLILLFGSCKKFIEVDPPSDRIVTSTLFKDETTANAAVIGLYAKMADGPSFCNSGVSTYAAASSDDLLYAGQDPEESAFFANKLASDNSIIGAGFWRKGYEIIYQANLCIGGLEASAVLKPTTKNQLIGEALVIRAFCYFYLANLFGDVPMVTGTDYQVNSVLSRTAVAEIKGLVINDLERASTLLSKDYPSVGKSRINYYTSLALLSRAYLYEENWIKAESTATEILDSKVYDLETDLNKVFLIPSTEAIWQLPQPASSIINTYDGNRFIPSTVESVVPAYPITTSLSSAFESGDMRKTAWVGIKIANGISYEYPSKYKVRFNFTRLKTESQIMFRLAEVYLIRAEARYKLNKLQDAISDLNDLRTRARATPTIAAPKPLPAISLLLSPNEVGVAIAHERRIELFSEWGHRWLDLKRTGKINDVMSLQKSNWTPNNSLYPIPNAEIKLNNKLIQNPGYN